MSKKKKKKKWIKLRHKIIQNVAYCLLYPYCKWKYGIKIEKSKELKKRQFLILYNHQTAFDQFFVGMPFKLPVYYVASEDIFSMGFISKLLKYAVEPIPIKKQTADVSAVLNCMRVAKEGGSIAIAPEGNRTFSGKTGHMNDAIVGLIKALKLPVAMFRLEGGYGVHPRWSDVVRRGSMRGYVADVLEPEAYAAMSDDEIYEYIKKTLYVDEACVKGEFSSDHLAEYLERAMYVCPEHGLSEFESHGDIIECKRCGKKIRYLGTKELVGVDTRFPFRFVSDWYDYQNDFVNNFDSKLHTDTPLYTEKVKLSEVIVYKSKNVLDEDVSLSLYGDKMTVSGKNIGEKVFSFDTVKAVTILGKNKLNVYEGKTIYQIKGDKRFCALKYLNLYHRYKNLISEVENGKFLGI
ncbi:MAG: 1-acyl-sn-glycerol-3-phosphate acyltransferase [Clostridia bacterium]|nr:1-acyl-sn-glycerol-3-phosphate acyltransferase [Clostridia bacterium]